jgi:hypothetical protein
VSIGCADSSGEWAGELAELPVDCSADAAALCSSYSGERTSQLTDGPAQPLPVFSKRIMRQIAEKAGLKRDQVFGLDLWHARLP